MPTPVAPRSSITCCAVIDISITSFAAQPAAMLTIQKPLPACGKG
jgi:hypothetical protein